MVTNVAHEQYAHTSSTASTEAELSPARQDRDDHLTSVGERDRSPLIFALLSLIVLAWAGAAVIWGMKGLLGVALLLVPTMGCLIILITTAR